MFVLAPAPYRPIVLAVLALPWMAFLVRDLERLLIGAIVLDMWLDIDVNLSWNESLAQRGGIGGVGISVTTLALGVLLLIQLARPAREMHRSALQIAVAAYAVLVFASLWTARDRDAAIAAVTPTIQAALTFIVFSRFMHSRDQIIFVVRTFLIGVAVTTIVGIEHFLQDDLHGRFAGAVTNANMLGTLLALALPLLAAIAFAGPAHRQTARLACAGGAIVLVLTQSRGSWISLAVAAIVLIAISVRRGWTEQRRPLLTCAALIMLASALPIVHNRVFGNDHGSAEGRFPLMSIAERMIRDHPLRGVGANNYAIALSDYLTPDTAREWVYTVHNQYLLIWAESGFFALAAFVAMIALAIRAGLAASRSTDRHLAMIGGAAAAALCGHAVHLSAELMTARVLLLMLVLVAAIAQAAAVVGCKGSRP